MTDRGMRGRYVAATLCLVLSGALFTLIFAFPDSALFRSGVSNSDPGHAGPVDRTLTTIESESVESELRQLGWPGKSRELHLEWALLASSREDYSEANHIVECDFKDADRLVVHIEAPDQTGLSRNSMQIEISGLSSGAPHSTVRYEWDSDIGSQLFLVWRGKLKILQASATRPFFLMKYDLESCDDPGQAPRRKIDGWLSIRRSM